MKIRIEIRFYNLHPMEHEDPSYKKIDEKTLVGEYNSKIENIQESLIYEIENISKGTHFIDLNTISDIVIVDFRKFMFNGSTDDFIKEIKEINSINVFESSESFKDDLTFLSDVNYVAFFTDNTNHFEVTGKDYLDFLSEEKIPNSRIAYNYSGTEMGAGHAYDSLTILFETVATGFFINELSRKYHDYIKKRGKEFKPIKVLDLSSTVHKILTEDYGVDKNAAKIIIANYDVDSLDFHLHIEEHDRTFYFIIDKDNRIVKFEVKNKY